ncbi:RagB/SusD family nutrient uptake outer membrane protein [Labilibacter marinus]|uniref:RagB/SusD family nutrient uptake outer membrane protein n=1 Tax=Labilibacter marinus TaxID=1477105 RepID=UPI00082BD472|nr:RagB/SusD family nutrient uptake outer membrane protein [Labilibacter marinus]
MKKLNKILALMLLIPVLFSCEDYLDKSPEMGLTEEKIYSDYYTFKGAVDRVNLLVHNYAHDRFDYGQEVGAFSDECQHVNPASGINKNANTGDWFDWQGPHTRWTMGNSQNEGIATNDGGSSEFNFRLQTREVPAEASVGIRACNQILANADLLKSFPEESEYTAQELKGQLVGQAFFLRGWFYFMLIRDFGGLPNMQTAFSVDEDFDVERPSYLESNEWLIQDLDSAIMYLPESWERTESRDAGRITKTTAKAVKAMALLYAASPHYNIPRSQSLSFKGTPTYNQEKAREALVACNEALNSALGHYRYELMPQNQYNDIFYRLGTNGISNEGIFQPYVSNATVNLQGNNTGTAWYLPHFDGGWGNYVVPTQNAVDWYETADGYKIEDAAMSSVWDPTDPYNNRDPRLKNNIFCHGDKMLTIKNKSFRGNLPPELESNEPNGKHYKYVKGKSRTYSGYFHAGKFRWPGNNKADKTNGYARTFSLIRFTQLYLDFAELANELYGPSAAVPEATGSIAGLTALNAINIIRDRVGMVDVQSIYSTDKATFRDYIRDERARELYSEQHRWWDLKRWRIAHEVLPQGIYGAYITEDGSGGFTYSTQKIAERVFENKHYWYPFPSSTINMMSKFEQNPGW